MQYTSWFYPMHLALLAVGENFIPIAWWTPISKTPFRFLFAVDKKNYTLALLREKGEAALCFLAWEERAWIVQAGYLSGRQVSKSQQLGISLRPARHLATTKLPEHSLAVFELRVHELPLDGDHVVFTGDVIHAEGEAEAKERPILFLGFRDFATLGERWRFEPRPKRRKKSLDASRP
jgi:flavin reductase (DIM6/NTAB) family NADH-FMN oxidoreductase RutF